jgi:CheY-like chemotaxis protein
MPELDGLETTRRLRALGGEAARTPVIAMTASAFDSDVAACAAAGLEGFLAKPYRREELAAALLPWVTIVHDDAT